MENCYKCGTPLDATSLGRKFCKNCGILLENQDFKSEKINDEDIEYVG